MTRVRVTFIYEPDDSDADPADPTGLTEEAFDELTDELGALGAQDTEITKVAE